MEHGERSHGYSQSVLSVKLPSTAFTHNDLVRERTSLNRGDGRNMILVGVHVSCHGHENALQLLLDQTPHLFRLHITATGHGLDAHSPLLPQLVVVFAKPGAFFCPFFEKLHRHVRLSNHHPRYRAHRCHLSLFGLGQLCWARGKLQVGALAVLQRPGQQRCVFVQQLRQLLVLLGRAQQRVRICDVEQLARVWSHRPEQPMEKNRRKKRCVSRWRFVRQSHVITHPRPAA
ncbi:uncharacterized protein YALI1_B09144g [Yarrowia lipolytica]|uniref:Uncharacterized protein n=1 Tax=Yarrowia lipolytica TaxID=4952 RepID=A0A1D8N6S8_YARLL|nr:hypothetical protein YALI1_B09144g [Yarrowia lipolytica]